MIDLFLVYSFLKRLTTPFDQWRAYELGIIDADGNELKKRSDLKTATEQNAYGVFDRLVARLKRLLARTPGGKTRLASYAAALLLIKEGTSLTEGGELLSEADLEYRLNQYINTIPYSEDVNKRFEQMCEDVPVNAAGSGAIAGIGIGPDGEPGMSKAAQRRYIKKRRILTR